MANPVLNIDYLSEYSMSIKFETEIIEKQLGSEQRYPVKIYPVRTFTLNFNKNELGTSQIRTFFEDLKGSYGLFDWKWEASKGGNDVTYTNCWFDSDTLKQQMKKNGYSSSQITFYAIDRNTPAVVTALPQYQNCEHSYESSFETIVDKVITAQIINNRKGQLEVPKGKWDLKFKINKASRQDIENFFINKRGKWKSFSWTWLTSKSGDGEEKIVRFDDDELRFDITSKLGYAEISLSLKEVFPTTPTPVNMKEKDEIIPRRLLFIDIEGMPVRILDNDTMESLSFEGNNYLGSPLELGDLTMQDTNSVIQLPVSISNAGGYISDAVNENGDIVTGSACSLSLVWLNVENFTLLTTPAPMTIIEGRANDLKIDPYKASINIETSLGGYEDEVPFRTYDPNCSYRKFKDIMCGYTGDQTTCDRTFITCKRLGNQERFGGFVSIIRQMQIRS